MIAFSFVGVMGKMWKRGDSYSISRPIDNKQLSTFIRFENLFIHSEFTPIFNSTEFSCLWFEKELNWVRISL